MRRGQVRRPGELGKNSYPTVTFESLADHLNNTELKAHE
jgi:hypothetical protein